MASMSRDQAAEVERLESEARAKAAKHVANMLARPDQLEKVEHNNNNSKFHVHQCQAQKTLWFDVHLTFT